jgi:hypothetical protein
MSRKQSEDIDLEELLITIRKDPKYKTLKKIIETAQQRLNIENDRSEAFALNASRLSRKLYGNKNYNPSSLLNACANDMSVRTRLVEIRTKASYHIETIEKALEAFQDYIVTQYNDELRKYSNEAQRKALVRRVQKIADTLITDGTDLLNLCDTIILDIDKSSYHIHCMVNLLQQLSQSVGGRVI